MTLPKTLFAVLAVAGIVACHPTPDWREFTPDGSGVVASFPCAPDHQARRVLLLAAPVQMSMFSCELAGATYALSFVDVAEPAAVRRALQELRSVALSHVQDPHPQWAPLQVPGMTPNDQAARLSAQGPLPDGTPMQLHAAFFVHGLRAYQASVVGRTATAASAQAFWGGLRFP